MRKSDEIIFNTNYQKLLKCLKLQGKADNTIAFYSRALRRVVAHFDDLPETLTLDNLKDYFSALVESHSWSTVKIDRFGLQFYWRHVLKKDWQWIEIVKPPKVKTIPDILPPSEIKHLIAATCKLRYRVFLLVTYSMGLRLEEVLTLQVGDIDSECRRGYIRRGKDHKHRLVPLPDLSLKALRERWLKHRHLVLDTRHQAPQKAVIAAIPWAPFSRARASKLLSMPPRANTGPRDFSVKV